MASTEDAKQKSLEKLYNFQDEFRFRKFKWASSTYYDYPDGQDLLGKLSYTTKLALLPSAVMGHIYITNFEPVAKTFKGKMFKMARVMVPGLGIAVAFTCVTYYATNFRKKDDPWNHVLGGVAGGAVTALAAGPALGVYVGGIMAAVFGSMKVMHLKGKPMFDIKKRYLSSYYKRNFDFTLVEPRPGNWTMDPPK